MKLHHQKHHQTYVNGLNAAKEKYEKSADVKEQISLQAAIKFNGGGASVFLEFGLFDFDFMEHRIHLRPY